MRLTLITIFISSILLLNGCSEEGHKKEFSYGAFENGQYINKFLGFSIDIPENWFVYNKEELKKVMDIVENDDSFNEEGKDFLQKSKVRSADLFMAQIYNPYVFDAIVNPTFTINAERIDDVKAIRSAEDYMKFARRNSQAMVKEPLVFKETARVDLNGNRFDRHTLEQSEMGYKFKTTQFCEIMNGYAVLFSITYSNESDRKELVKCLSSLDYKN